MSKLNMVEPLIIMQYIIDKILRLEQHLLKPSIVVLDKKTYKILTKTQTALLPTINSSKLFGLKIKIVKTKEQIICIGE